MDQERDEINWRGCSMKEIYRNLPVWELKHVQSIRPSENHTVLYHWPITNLNEPPKPQKGFMKWDNLHVRLPCSPKSQYPVTQDDGTVGIENRWHMIEKALLKSIKNSREFEMAVLSYNSKYQNLWKFRALHKLFEEELEEEESSLFFEDLLPKIIRLALRLPELIMTSIPLLKQGQNRSISISQQQIACLLANAFLCTFPRRNTMKKKSEYSTFPDINFNRLFQSSGHQVIEKIKCICHYFRRVCNKMPNGVLTFTRRSLTESELPNWEECNAPLGATPIHVTSVGTIEDQGQGLLQVDFANKFLGGGVLGSGCVQEEIRFVICPELIISKLFTEALKPCEALLMIGCEQYSKYTGYSSNFMWNGNFEDETPFDDSGRRQCHIVAIDALFFMQSSHQYREELMLRELNKAFVGFLHPLDTPAPGVASGNWGCGAFGGEASLKALIQLMACTVTKRPLVYFTFGKQDLRDSIYNMHTFFIENNITIKQLWNYLKKFYKHNLSPNDLYSFIVQIHCDNQKEDDKKEVSISNRLNVITKKTEIKMSTVQLSTYTQKATATNNKISGKIFQIWRKQEDNAKVVPVPKRRSSSPEELDYFNILENDGIFKEETTFTQKTSSNKLNVPKSYSMLTIKNESETKMINSTKNLQNSLIKSDEDDEVRKDISNLNVEKVGTSLKAKASDNDVKKKHNFAPLKSLKEKSIAMSSSKSSQKKKSKVQSKNPDPKQRSLLDMLDLFYTERPAKRHCVSSSEKNS